jgi:hypothetical protein
MERMETSPNCLHEFVTPRQWDTLMDVPASYNIFIDRVMLFCFVLIVRLRALNFSFIYSLTKTFMKTDLKTECSKD